MLSSSVTSKTLYLDNTSQNVVISDVFAPFSLTLDPRNVEFYEKIRAIEYIWGDGTSDIIKYEPSVLSDINLPFPYEVGNPLNYPVTKNFYSNDLNLSVYNIVINFYCLTNTDPYVFNVTLNLKNPDIDYSDNSFFSDVHLIKTKMYGPDDKLLYVFQSQNEEYVLMSNVNWKLKPVDPITVKSLNRPYSIQKPFETRYTANTGIRAFPYVKDILTNPDNDIAPIRALPIT